MTRRNLLRLGIVSSLSGGFYGCGKNCAAGFPPNLAMPVFHGYKDYTVDNNSNHPAIQTGAVRNTIPVARVFYPSIDRNPATAAILTDCERFPLVLLIHGQCPGGDPYLQWSYF